MLREQKCPYRTHRPRLGYQAWQGICTGCAQDRRLRNGRGHYDLFASRPLPSGRTAHTNLTSIILPIKSHYSLLIVVIIVNKNDNNNNTSGNWERFRCSCRSLRSCKPVREAAMGATSGETPGTCYLPDTMTTSIRLIITTMSIVATVMTRFGNCLSG